jgi:hypothetical protein
MMRITLVVLLALVLGGQATAETAIVVPNAYENTEAPDGVAGGSGFQNGYRIQGIFDASVFVSLPGTQQTMTGFYMRPDGLLGTENSTSWPHFTLKMSTTEVTPATLSNEFAANAGEDELIVYDGSITFTTANIGPSGGPKEFDIAYEFQTPFHYDPSQGNLLMDWYVEGPADLVGDDRIDGPTGIVAWVFSEDRNASLGEPAGTGTPVIKFTFVPEPSTLLLLLLGLSTVGISRRRSRA